MRTTVTINVELFNDATEITGITEKAALIQEGLKALIEREAALKLARLGGTEPQLKRTPRRQSK